MDPYNPNEDLGELVCYCARVSNPSNQWVPTKEGNQKLISYLIRNHHWSPFEMVSVTLEINTTRDIARQMLRHRSFTFQEFSQRYANPVGDLGVTLREARLQDHKNRQNSVPLGDSREDIELLMEWNIKQEEVSQNAIDAYNWALSKGIAKEQARVVLPEGNMNSRLYMSGTLRSWIHYVNLRSSNGTQLEHQEIALEIKKGIQEVFPYDF